MPDTITSPIRTCVGCRARRAQYELCRYVVGVDGRPTQSRTASGRGAWLCPNGECLAAAEKNHAFERAWKTRLTRQSRRTMAN